MQLGRGTGRGVRCNHGACAKKIGVNVPHSMLAGDFVLMVTCQIEYSLLIQCHTFFCLS